MEIGKMARLADMEDLQSGFTAIATSTGHLVLKPVVKNRGTKPPQSAYLYAGNLTITSHFLERFRMNLEKSRGLIAIEKFLKRQFSNPVDAADRFARNIGHRDLQAVIYAARGCQRCMRLIAEFRDSPMHFASQLITFRYM